jgi:alkanesulfonate monooxygenase SsuD/methylene tetrahydromethanopterin reductase-like flavin-dependent oxidoreductase (luciferase family)
VHAAAGAELEPKPERPIPIWLGTFGPRALAVTGRYADGWIPSLGYAGDQLGWMRGQVLAAARAGGRAPGDVTCALHLEVCVGRPAGAGPGVVSGSPAAIAGRLGELAEAGFTAFSLSPAGPQPASEQVEQLAADVLPRLRG